MLGAVTLTQGGNTVNGGRLTINLDTGRAVIDGSSVGSAAAPRAARRRQRGGRVTGTFSVPDRNSKARGSPLRGLRAARRRHA